MEHICGSCFHEMKAGEKICSRCGYNPAENREKYPMALPDRTALAGRYVVGKVLGQGGFGITYLAWDYKHHKIVAVKEYLPGSFVSRSRKLTVSVLSAQKQNFFDYGKESFLKEAKTLAAFGKQSNVPRVYRYFEENGTAYFVMQYIEGQNLRDYLRRHGEKFSWEKTCELLLPIAGALDTMHAKGIIHRDIKPENIMIDKKDKAWLLDFGAARYSTGEASQSLSVILTSGYAPFEQYSRRGRQGPYTDVYAFAATMYRCLTGRKPPESVERITQDTIAAPSALGVKLPKGKGKVLKKALAVMSDERYQTMGEFIRDLDTLDPAETAYRDVVQKMKDAKTEADFQAVIDMFEKMKAYKESAVLQDICRKEILKIQEEKEKADEAKAAAFAAALKDMTKAATIEEYDRLTTVFKNFGDYKDSKALSYKCEEQSLKMKKKLEKKKNGGKSGCLWIALGIIVAALLCAIV